MNNTHTRQRRRRSLLALARDSRKQWPFWKILLASNAILVLLVFVGVMLRDPTRPFEALGTIPLIAIAYCTPITTAAYFSTNLVRKWAGGLSRSMRIALLVLAWMASGVIGSFLTYVTLYYFAPSGAGTTPPSSLVTSMLLTNGVVAIAIGTFIFLFELMRGSIRRRAAILGEQDMLTAELEAARNVQRSLLPSEDLVMAGFDISGITEPAVEIGGDYYDYISFAEGTKGILVADAAGKGVPAALVMAKFQGMAQALSIHVSSPEEFFTGLNDTLRTRLDRRSFITVGMVTIDFDDRCRFYRAGHNPLLLYRAATGKVELLRPPGMALGLLHGPAHTVAPESACFMMEKDDIALLYSDGLTEATDHTGDAFGEDRVADALRDAAGSDLDAVLTRNAILAKLAEFVGDGTPHDDVTVVVIRKA